MSEIKSSGARKPAVTAKPHVRTDEFPQAPTTFRKRRKVSR